jgi:hypothetical protein
VFDNGGLQAQDDSDADFTIADPGVPVTLVSPNGSENVKSGTNFEIRWEVPIGFETQVLGFDLFLSTDGGVTFPIGIQDDPIAPKLPAGARLFEWPVPSNICTTTARVLVRATSIIGSRSVDSSNANFSITAPGPTINVEDMRLSRKQIDLRTIQPVVGEEIRFDREVEVLVATDATGTQFAEFRRLKWKKSGRKLISKGPLGGQNPLDFFPDGATRLIIVTNPPCGVTFLRVTRQGERLVLATPAPVED